MSPSACCSLLIVYMVHLCAAFHKYPRLENGICSLKGGLCLLPSDASVCNPLDAECDEGHICCEVTNFGTEGDQERSQGPNFGSERSGRDRSTNCRRGGVRRAFNKWKEDLAKSDGKTDVPDLMYQYCMTLDDKIGRCRVREHCLLNELYKDCATFRKYSCKIDESPPQFGFCCPNLAPLPESTPLDVLSPEIKMECGVSAKAQNRIVGGTKTAIGEYPWTVSINSLEHYPNHYCGGSLISSQHVLTAAHCFKDSNVYNTESIWVRLGEYDYKTRNETPHIERRVSVITIHPSFKKGNLENDIALLTLEYPVHYNNYIRPICLPSTDNLFTGSKATVVGWGKLKYKGQRSSVLNKVKVPIWSKEECKGAYGNRIYPMMFCAGNPEGGEDACQFDSGGPLMVMKNNKWTQVGVVSWGIKCAMPNNPGVYTRVSLFLDWISNNMS